MLERSVLEALEQVAGRENVLTAMEDRVCYAYDASQKEIIPDAVIFPRQAEDIAGAVRVANEHGISVVPRGAGSGMTGGCVPEHGGLVLALSRFNRILEIDTENLVAVVEPGVVTATLQKGVEEKGLFYPPDPASMTFATIGGNIAENSGGMRAVKYGTTKDYVLGLEVVLPTGRIIHTGSKCVKDVVGYNLTQLFVGSEGTLGVVTKAILKLLPLPEATKTLSATFPSMLDAGRTVSGIIQGKIVPTAMEFLDRQTLWCVDQYLQTGLAKGAGAFLLVELDGDVDLVEKNIQKVKAVCERNRALNISIAKNKQEQEELWRMRRSVSPSLSHHKPIRKINEDIVVPRARVPEMIEAIEEIGARFDQLIVNFGHAGDGNIHVNVMPRQEPVDRAYAAVEAIFDKTIEFGGRISGEHGIGMSKRTHISKNLEPEVIETMRSIKQALDPNGILNPGKMFPE